MSRRKPWQRPGGDVRAADLAARNQALADQLRTANDDRAALHKALQATERQVLILKQDLAAAQSSATKARMRTTDLELDLAALTGQLEKELEHSAGNCSHAAELKDMRRQVAALESRVRDLQRANESHESEGWTPRQMQAKRRRG